MDIATVDKLLTTTRSVRKRLDLTRPVEREMIETCLEIAIQAPTGSNMQGWHFMVVTDVEKRAKIGALYKKAWEAYRARGGPAPSRQPDIRQMVKVVRSSEHLAEHMGEVPVMVIPCIEGRVENEGVAMQASIYGSILPAAWSFMLALRARGLGSAWTTLHLLYEKEVAALLGIPDTITQAALLPVAYYTGDDFHPAKRRPASEVTHWDQWE